MAHLRQVGNGWQIQYYLNNRRRTKQYPPGTPKTLVMAEKKKLEHAIVLHKSGIKKFAEHDDNAEFMTLFDRRIHGIDLDWQRPLVRMRVQRADGRNSMWLPLFTGPKPGRVQRLLRQFVGG